MRQEKRYFPKQAQGLIELSVFGSILIFLLAVIISQGIDAATANSRNSVLMRKALLTSYLGDYFSISPSFFVVEDRITPGVTKYGEIDRQAYMFSGNGTLSSWLYYTPDDDEAGATQHMTVFVNGQRFNIPTTAQTDATVSTGSGLAGSGSGNSVEINDRLNRENGAFCTHEKNTADNEKYCHSIGEELEDGYICTEARMIERFNLKRVAGVTALPENYADLSWQWRCERPDTVYAEVTKPVGGFPSYDFNGDLVEESIYMMKKQGSDYVIRSIAQGVGADNPNCVASGLLPEMSIYTNNQNVFLKIEEDAGNHRTRNVKSSSGKNQVDLIERQYQIPRGVGANIGGVASCASLGRTIGCDEKVPQGNLCCFQGSLRWQTCLDTSTNILYIRSILNNTRQTSWQGKKKIN